MKNIDNISVEKSTVDDKWHMLDDNIKLLVTEYYNRTLALGHIIQNSDEYYSPEASLLKVYAAFVEARNNYEKATISKNPTKIKPNVTKVTKIPHKIKKIVVKTFTHGTTIQQKIVLNNKLNKKFQKLIMQNCENKQKEENEKQPVDNKKKANAKPKVAKKQALNKPLLVHAAEVPPYPHIPSYGALL